MFDNITKNISKIFDSLSRKKSISEEDLNLTIREIRIALLEADISLAVVKKFIEKIKEEAIGKHVLKSVSASQMIIKIVNDCLIDLLGNEKSEINFNTSQPAIILFVGLQGSGKTTSCAKIALKLKNKNHKKILLASLDSYRPAAKKQLELLANKIEVDSLAIEENEIPYQTTKRAIKHAKDFGYDALILDSAGRTSIDEEMMNELVEIKKLSNPSDILISVDAMIGQDSINVIKSFDEKLKISGAVITRLDGDSRGGVALTIKESTGCPIKFIGVGENVEDIEEFDPKRIASRIIGMGDVVSLVEKAQEIFDKDDLEKSAKKLASGKFDLNDLLNQIKNMKKMGGMSSIIKFLPKSSQIQEHLDKLGNVQKDISIQEALILSMTKKERQNPDILNSSRKRRIAAGAGSNIQEVNRLLKKYKQMQKMTKKFGKIDKNKLQEIIKEQNIQDPSQLNLKDFM